MQKGFDQGQAEKENKVPQVIKAPQDNLIPAFA